MKSAVAIALAVFFAAGSAAAEEETQDQPEAPSTAGLGSLQRFSQVSLSLRSQWVPNAGYDPFAKTDFLAAWSFAGSRTFWVKDRFSLAVGLGIDLGASSSEARGQKTALGAHRFTVPLEARYHITPWLYAFGKVAPGPLLMTASIKDGSAGDQALSDTGVVFAADASLGAAFLFTSRSTPERHPPRFWATGEWGYGWTTSREWQFSPSDQDKVTGRVASANLGEVAFRGTFFRLGAALSF